MKFVLAGYFGFGNFGDEAILKYAVDILRFYYKNCDISVITNNTFAVKKNFNAKGIARFDLKDILNEIKTSDYLLFPGGSVLQDVTSLKSIIYYLALILIALFYKKKFILLAQGFGPINNKFARNLTFKLLKKAALITLRDEKSYDTLMQNGVMSECTADLLWAFTQKSKQENDDRTIIYGDIACSPDKEKIGIQLRSWHNMTSDKLEILAQNILKNFPHIEYDYKLICLQKNSDKEIMIELGNILHNLAPKACIELCIEDDTEKNIELLQSVKYMIAMRFHAGLCSINAEKALLMISYDPKTEEFCNELGLQYIDVNNFTKEEVYEKFKWLKEFNPTRTALKTNILVKKSQQNVDYLTEEIDK